jgi:hypothetical protein
VFRDEIPQGISVVRRTEATMSPIVAVRIRVCDRAGFRKSDTEDINTPRIHNAIQTA